MRQRTPDVKTQAYVSTERLGGGSAGNFVQTNAEEEHVDTPDDIKSELVKAHRTASTLNALHISVGGIAYAPAPLIGKRTVVEGTLRSTQANGVVEGEIVED